MLCVVLGFAQDRNIGTSQYSVDIIPVRVQPFELDKSVKDFNPNGVKLYFDADKNFVNLRFERILSKVQLEFLNQRGRVINRYSGENIAHIKINLARLPKGKYYIRVKSREIKDFLKISKEQSITN